MPAWNGISIDGGVFPCPTDPYAGTSNRSNRKGLKRGCNQYRTCFDMLCSEPTHMTQRNTTMDSLSRRLVYIAHCSCSWYTNEPNSAFYTFIHCVGQ
ncbi:hypothetical protein Y032_0042g521 [Ancylostoma ceylanicum]|uniref:Uncharacterized protein n=1 Tax=Ancylostoma ceylanicum TaxID=53326 RepID=A0A016UFY4_9BILA|nr:hypothetical protein Y032_0042g521 [Ancylostoma ceylanicum]